MIQTRTGFVQGAVVFLVLLCGVVIADEGMWTYNNLPTEILKEKYGFEPTQEWTEHLMKSSVRFNSGGSGSFISPRGLVLTNHHVGADALAKISTAEHDYYREGFLARTESEEIKAPDLELNQLLSIEDVTDKVNGAVKPGMSVAEAAAARRAAIATIEKESLEKTGLRSDVVTLYQGGKYQLYRYKKYTDIRLVFSPEFDIAFFGGDPDNFEYPRFNLDMCLFRVYENGQPVQTEHFLKWSAKGTNENDLVFVSGHPGSTRRMYTLAALAFLRDIRVPYQLEYLNRQEIMLQQFGGKGIEEARRAKEDLFSVQNSRKVYYGRVRGLQDPEVFRKKQKDENSLIAEVKSRPDLKDLGGAWATIELAQKSAKKLLVKRSLLEGAQAFNSQLFSIARTLVRLAEESSKPNEERLPEYRDSNRASLEQQLYSEAPIYEDLEVAKLTEALTFFVSKMGESNSLVKQVLAGKSPSERAIELVEKTS
ncbi:MAG: S46 family peptidase, partial [Proteobacteria bacterium]|nr:S46 family peptidase [Pseudomonadota bacterium]